MTAREKRLRMMLRMHKENRRAETPEEKALLRELIERHASKAMDRDDRRMMEEEEA